MADPMTWRAFDKKRRMHPRALIHEERTVGERLADGVAAVVGSWPFILSQSVFLAAWIAANVHWHLWDQYPFILLNLCLSFQAAYTGPIVMMSQNRQAAKDRKRDDVEAKEVRQSLDILTLVHAINERQTELLMEMRAMRDEERLSE